MKFEGENWRRKGWENWEAAISVKVRKKKIKREKENIIYNKD